MPTIELKALKDVVPKYVNDAKPDGKYGNIKMADDTVMFVPKAMVAQFTANEPAKVEYETQKWTKGPVQVVTKKIGGNGATVAKQFDRASTSPKDATHIATLALAKEYVARGDTPADARHITRLLDMCFDGYMASKLSGHKKQTAPDMNDELPEDNWATNSENPAD